MEGPSFTRALLALACMFCIIFPASGAIITAGAGGMYGSIQDAVDHAPAGSTVLVHSGTYLETVRLPLGITLRGTDTGSGLPLIDAQGEGSGIVVEGTGVTIAGFSISNAGANAGIRVTGDQATIRECSVSGSQEGILIEGSQGTQV
ncbi:MAG: hypothetical protein LUQ13_04505, partial [Methanomicrobiales archaeon]|nr:hypothetical protein [Methanomicrobiales archaeon]